MKKNIKQEILDATIQLIEENGSDPAAVTIREICERVGIGVGLVNYHFQTKENLINQCVQHMISQVILRFDALYQSLDGLNPNEKLRFMVKSTSAFLARNENISRVSILTDLTQRSVGDNTTQTMQVYYPLLRAALPSHLDDREVRIRLNLMIFCLQSSFLRRSQLQDELGIDFLDPAQRDAYVDQILDLVLADPAAAGTARGRPDPESE